ncbi:MAG: hypothetical protein HKL81_07755 [Acidimicrobiaceae bacterium]|nr:hypothetical protein [Acidimicrobiaceae bacterium]
MITGSEQSKPEGHPHSLLIDIRKPRIEANSVRMIEFYKNLANVEKVFRSLKSINVRPVRHFLEKRVRAHVFLCVLSAHLLHFAKEKLAPLTFRGTERPIPISRLPKK